LYQETKIHYDSFLTVFPAHQTLLYINLAPGTQPLTAVGGPTIQLHRCVNASLLRLSSYRTATQLNIKALNRGTEQNSIPQCLHSRVCP